MLAKLFLEIQTSYESVIQNGTQLSGRMARRQFWLFYGTGYSLLTLFSSIITFKMYRALTEVPLELYPEITQSFTPMLLLSGVFSLVFQVVALPSLVRRFQDTDRKALACYAYVGLQLITFLYQAVVHSSGLALPQTLIVLFDKLILLPSFALSIYVLFVLCLKGCEGRNSFGIQVAPSSASPNPA